MSKASHIMLLRGVNVGGKNKLPMKTFAAMCEEQGAEDVRTYIQSGNAVLRTTAARAKKLPAALQAAFRHDLGLDVPVVIRTLKQLRAVVVDNPFVTEEDDPKKLHVAFASGKLRASAFAALDPERSPPDRFAAHGSELYLHFPRGTAKSKLTNAYLDRTLATTVTIRNWRTVNKLLELAEG